MDLRIELIRWNSNLFAHNECYLDKSQMSKNTQITTKMLRQSLSVNRMKMTQELFIKSYKNHWKIVLLVLNRQICNHFSLNVYCKLQVSVLTDECKLMIFKDYLHHASSIRSWFWSTKILKDNFWFAKSNVYAWAFIWIFVKKNFQWRLLHIRDFEDKFSMLVTDFRYWWQIKKVTYNRKSSTWFICHQHLNIITITTSPTCCH